MRSIKLCYMHVRLHHKIPLLYITITQREKEYASKIFSYISVYVIYIKIEILFFLSFQSPVCGLYSISHFKFVLFQVFDGHM